MIVYIYNIGVDLYNGFNGLRHRINWTYFTVLDGLAHPLYSTELLATKTFDDYYTNELLLLSDTIKQSCFEILFNSHIEC